MTSGSTTVIALGGIALGGALLAEFYVLGIFIAVIVDGISEDGWLWRGLFRPFAWTWIAARHIARAFAVGVRPARRPLRTRADLEHRIAELERQLDL